MARNASNASRATAVRLERLRIRNFKCFVDAEFSLAEATVIAGANNSGKTTVVEAIRLLFGANDRFGRPMTFEAARARAARPSRTDTLAAVMADVATAPPVLIRAEFGDLSEDEAARWMPILIEGRLVVGVSISYGDTGPTTRAVMTDDAIEFFAIAAKLARGEARPSDAEVPALVDDWRRWMTENLEPLGVDGEWWLGWDFLEEWIYQEAWPEPYPEPGDGFRVPQDHSLAYIGGPEVGSVTALDVLRPVLMEQAVMEMLRGVERNRTRDEPMDEYLDAAKTAAEQVSTVYSRAIPRFVPDFQSARIEPGTEVPNWAQIVGRLLDTGSVRLVSEAGQAVDIEEMGAGARRASAMAALEVYRDPELWPPHRWALLIVEEPEVGLHPGAQRRVAQALAALPTYGVQTVVVSHSPVFLNGVKPEQVRIARRATNDAGDPSHVVVDSVGLREIAAELGVTPADALLADRFLIVEGEIDVRLIEVWAERLDMPLAEGVRIVDAKGHGHEPVVTRLAALAYEGAQFWALVDGGPPTAPTGRKLAGLDVPRLRVITLDEEEIEAYLPPAAIARWMNGQGAEVLPAAIEQRLAAGGKAKDALGTMIREFLGRNYRGVEDAPAIARAMTEAEVPAEFRDLIREISEVE